MTQVENPFRWQETKRPSIFLEGSKQFSGLSNGKTYQQNSSEWVSREIAKTGRSPGTVHGISRRSSEQIEQGRARNRAGRTGAL